MDYFPLNSIFDGPTGFVQQVPTCLVFNTIFSNVSGITAFFADGVVMPDGTVRTEITINTALLPISPPPNLIRARLFYLNNDAPWLICRETTLLPIAGTTLYTWVVNIHANLHSIGTIVIDYEPGVGGNGGQQQQLGFQSQQQYHNNYYGHH
jgi:hypothetical protein